MITEQNTAKNRPFSKEYENKIFTGQEYLNSLDDGREIWFNGERITNIAEHKAFRNSARSIARFYDAMHDERYQDDLLLVDKNGIVTHKFFAPSYTPRELDEARKAIEVSQRINYGWMGRTPEYKAAFMAHLQDNAGFYQKEFQQNAINWYKKTAEKCLFLNHVLVDPPVDRSKDRVNVKNVFVSVDKEDDKGIYVSGAKMVATGSVLTHGTFVGLTGNITSMMEKDRDEDMAVIFFADMNTPGLKMICRPSYEHDANSAYDAPLSSRYDENDSVIIMDHAFIPWENVLVYRDIDRCKQFYKESGFFNRYNLQAAVRLAIKLEFCIGLFSEGTKASGTAQFRGVQAGTGELIGIKNTLWSLTTSMVNDVVSCGTGVVPNAEVAAALRLYMSNCWDRVREIFESVLGGAPVYTISSNKDLLNVELRPYIEQYYVGTGLEATDRIKLFKLIWDSMYSEFAGRHSLYERNYSGSQDLQRLDLLRQAMASKSLDKCTAMVQKCMDDYDINGWTNTWLT
ncbi:4-hydroxyphenylacetate 3-hydroxylase family protein [Aquimarina hainanensis]|uniref:4-hydroxyphenylacetate 3-hydroxylase family protein n=1 Tax=Aquimarina hainanensis TaxID=1578017 RepID=A0ABW5NB47_9FLAO|nr:4-hydroxyphenylacetate 3-hydroxylase N-terminal domain-containing protein [Aquimarina sp. TRL1]QKX05444.1 Pyoverdin chromophore biosynthetic protein pvcC [Aquimarina sp. TRL1]